MLIAYFGVLCVYNTVSCNSTNLARIQHELHELPVLAEKIHFLIKSAGFVLNSCCYNVLYISVLLCNFVVSARKHDFFSIFEQGDITRYTSLSLKSS